MLSTIERPEEVTSSVTDLSNVSLAEIVTADFSDSITRILGKSLNPPAPVAAFSSSI